MTGSVHRRSCASRRFPRRGQPRDHEILVRVHAATVSATDRVARQGVPRYARAAFGIRRPRHAVLGTDFAGEVAATGHAAGMMAHFDVIQ
jgi:NADPH:quinone reductase-like Zn-dependent oxidoreductase